MSDDQKLVYWQASTAAEIAGTDIHSYWYTQKHSAVTVEATAYALMAQVVLAKIKYPGKPNRQAYAKTQKNTPSIFKLGKKVVSVGIRL